MRYHNVLLPLHHEFKTEKFRLDTLYAQAYGNQWYYVRYNSEIIRNNVETINNFFTYWYPYLQPRGKTMATKKSSKGKFEGFEMIQIGITDAEKKDFKKWLADHVGSTDAIVAEMLNEGYKISISKSESNERVYGSMTSNREDNDDYRSTLTSHANDWLTAVLLSYWKWDKLSKRVLTPRSIDTGDDIG